MQYSPTNIAIEKIENLFLYHFMINTDVLSIQIEKDKPPINEITPYDIMNIVAKYKCNNVAYFYPEDFYPYAKDIAELVTLKNAKNIIISNGLESENIVSDFDWVDAISIELTTPNQKIFNNIKTIYSKNIWLEITTPTFDIQTIKEIAKFISSIDNTIPWHLYHIKDISILQKAYNIAKEYGLKYIYLENIDFPKITYCPNCNQEIIIRNKNKIIKNELTHNQTCPICNTKIAGIWKKKSLF